MSLIESFSPFQSEQYQEDLVIHHSWEDHLVDQLREKSQQPHIKEMTPEDADLRFTTNSHVERWLTDRFSRNEPMISWLGTQTGELAAIAYIENAHVRKSKGVKVFGVRSYQGFEGVGNAKLLTSVIHERFDEVLPGRYTQYRMHMKNNAGFVLGLTAGYKLNDTSGKDVQTYIRNPR